VYCQRGPAGEGREGSKQEAGGTAKQEARSSRSREGVERPRLVWIFDCF